MVYILKCIDASYYTGITDDLDERLWQHTTGFFQECYTYTRRPVQLVWLQMIEDAYKAMKRKKQIKGWSRQKKEALINNNIEKLKELSKSKK